MTAPEDLYDISAETGWPMVLQLPSPANPMAVARDLIEEAKKADMVTRWRGDFYQWTSTHWERWHDEEVRSWLYRCTEHAVFMTKVKGETGLTAVPWAPTKKKISDLIEALGQGVILRDSREPAEDGAGIVAFTNGVLDLASMELLDHVPGRFNLHCLPVAYAETATCPQWLKFLGSVLEDDADRIATLQEWFGYVLCGGTELQKILSMNGPKRCGKGTVLRIITALVGEPFVSSPTTLDSLAGNFGMEKLLGSRLTTLADIQWVGAHLPEVVGILLSVSGEDHQSVARKNRTDWSGKLATRFMLAGNDPPKFRNTSGALASRLIHLKFRISFYGREDAALTGKLMAELAGIFNWSLEGWRRLGEQGFRFTQSEMSERTAAEVDRNASPLLAFGRDICVDDDEASVDLDELYKEYERWRSTEDLEGSIGKPSFSRDLQSAFAKLWIERVGSARAGNRRRIVHGLRLRRPDELEPPPPRNQEADPAPDPADPADPDALFDHPVDEVAGQTTSGPGGPGGPGILTKSQYGISASAESTTPSEVSAVIGNPPGPSGSGPHKAVLTSANIGPGAEVRSGSAESATWDREKWADGWDREPDEAA